MLYYLNFIFYHLASTLKWLQVYIKVSYQHLVIFNQLRNYYISQLVRLSLGGLLFIHFLFPLPWFFRSIWSYKLKPAHLNKLYLFITCRCYNTAQAQFYILFFWSWQKAQIMEQLPLQLANKLLHHIISLCISRHTNRHRVLHLPSNLWFRQTWTRYMEVFLWCWQMQLLLPIVWWIR